MKLDEVRLHHRVEESLASRRHENGLDFLHDGGVLALRGRKEGGEISTAICRKKKRMAGVRT